MNTKYNNLIYANQWINWNVFDTWDSISVQSNWNKYELISIFDDDQQQFKLYNTNTKSAYEVASLSSLTWILIFSQQTESINKISGNISNILQSNDKRPYSNKIYSVLNFDCKILHQGHTNIKLDPFDSTKLYHPHLTTNKTNAWQLVLRSWWRELYVSQVITNRRICGHFMIQFDDIVYIVTEYRDSAWINSYYINWASIKTQHPYTWNQEGLLISLTSRADNKTGYTLFQYLWFLESTWEFVWWYISWNNLDVFRFLPFDSSDQMIFQELSNPWDYNITRLTQKHPDLSKNDGDMSFA